MLQIVVSCTKGISVDSLETVNQILTRVLPEALHSRLAYLSGPSFAAEVSACLRNPEQLVTHGYKYGAGLELFLPCSRTGQKRLHGSMTLFMDPAGCDDLTISVLLGTIIAGNDSKLLRQMYRAGGKGDPNSSHHCQQGGRGCSEGTGPAVHQPLPLLPHH